MTLQRRTPLRAQPRSKGNRLCACGCGIAIPELTSRGKPQQYVHGHNARMSLDDLVRVQDRGWITMCHIWTGGKSGNGYGRCRYQGIMQPAHRAFFVRTGGVVPEGYELDHLCEVRLCVNPTHLEPVTPTENKRRSRSTKLTAEQVAEIRAVHTKALAAAPPLRDGKQRQRVPGGVALREELGARYGVTPDMIKHIWRGSSWR